MFKKKPKKNKIFLVQVVATNNLSLKSILTYSSLFREGRD